MSLFISCLNMWKMVTVKKETQSTYTNYFNKLHKDSRDRGDRQADKVRSKS